MLVRNTITHIDNEGVPEKGVDKSIVYEELFTIHIVLDRIADVEDKHSTGIEILEGYMVLKFLELTIY